MANRTCTFPGCGGKHDSHGYCSAHALQLRKGQQLKPLRPSWKRAPCTATPGCGEPIVARGYCSKHWQAWRKHGDPLVDLVSGREGSRRYTLNESYFDVIDTEAKAYWLGFITADGGVIKDAKTNALRVELAERDGDHVRLLAQALGSDKPPWRRRTFVGSSFDSWRMVESLDRLGITPRKSGIVKPWAGPADLMNHYWRGLFDGDGTICHVGSDTRWQIGIYGSEACVCGFAAWAARICGSRAIPRGGTTCWYWRVGGNRMARMLSVALYDNATVFLPRKRERAERLMACG